MSKILNRLFAAASSASPSMSSDASPVRGEQTTQRKEYGAHDNYQFDVSKWNAMLHEVRCKGNGVLSEARRKIQNVVADSNLDENPKGAVSNAIESSTGFSREVFSRLYGNPPRLDENDRHGPDWMNDFQERASELPEWEELRKNVMGDPDFAAIATAGILDRVADDLGKYMERKEKENEGEAGDYHGIPGLTAEDGLMASVAAACEKATEEVKETKSAMSSLVPGSEHVPSGADQEDPARMTMAERLLKMGDVREMIERCGRIQRIAGRSNPTASSEPEEITGIDMGDDVQYMLLTEAIDLLTPELEALFYMKYAERSLLQYDRESVEPQGRGPMVVLLDESGSMCGDNHSWARAIGAACIGMGMKDSRPVTVVGFNSGIRSVHHVTESGDGMMLDTDNPDVVDAYMGAGRAVMQVLTQNCGGGTDYDTVLSYALNSGIRNERADLIFVTDDACSVSSEILNEIQSCREDSGLRIFGMTIGGGSLNGAVQSICDEVLDLDSGDVGNSVGQKFRSMK